MKHIVVHEVGPRDGLQMERLIVPTDTKESWIRQTMGSGVDVVQVSVQSALYHRERTGEGQFIDIAMLDSIMPMMGWVDLLKFWRV